MAKIKEPQDLHVVLFPFLAHGHMIPTLNVARVFAARGVRATIITTPLNVPTFTKPLEKMENGALTIDIEVFSFPSVDTGLPEGCESLDQVMGPGPAMFEKFFKAVEMFRSPLEDYLEKTQPDCLVADMFFPWATDSAAKFNIPRLVFHGIGFFALCARDVIARYQPYKDVSSNEESFVLPLFPHEIKLTRLQIAEQLWRGDENEFKKRSEEIMQSEVKSYGVIVNSFYELEPDYADLYRKELGRKAWHIGPVSLCNRGNDNTREDHECLRWLNSKKPSSVIYICFGSTAHFITPQLYEIAVALEASKQDFIWVVRDNGEKSQEWLPRGFEERMQEKGMIIKGWAPQVSILEHKAVGGFVTHCGWNSTLEGVSAGVPMVTWPIFAEQFYNEKLVNEVLKIGVAVGAKRWTTSPSPKDVVKADAIAKAVREVMVGEEAEERRTRGEKLKEMAWKAVQEDGSSYADLSALINELRFNHTQQQN